ncbi:hypothetical protein HC928_20275, partial [bacterium]|nr:hypothetical protein [bacterium]
MALDDRNQLFQALSELPRQVFERLLFALKPPAGLVPGPEAPQMNRVKFLLDWAEGSSGRGIDEIRHYLEQATSDVEGYLTSLIATYEKWWEYYTLTDVEGKVEQPAPEKPSVFDFGLTVQTVAKDKDAPGSDPRSEEREKIERLPVLEGIRKYADDHVLLVGRPGSGKSTALIRLLLQEAHASLAESPDTLTPSPSLKLGREEPERIPVLVELRYWEHSIEGLIQGFLQRHGLTLDGPTLSTLLGQGRFLLLVDGLNELPSEEARTQLSAFRRNHPQVPMIFTTRDLGLGGDLGIEKKLEMQPLTEAQMKAFIRAYVPDQAEAMLRQLNDRLREFGQTPLLLWMLCEVFQQSPNWQMPTNLAEVFRIFTKGYEESAQRKHEVAALKGDVKPLSDRRLWKEALIALAARMMQGETLVDFRVAIHRTEAERELSKIFANEKFPARDILDDLLKYYLLQKHTTDQLEFRHQLIQEYYAAEHLLRLLPKLTDDQLKRDYLNYLKWTEPIALMLALVDEEKQALRVVKLAMDDVDLMLGARLAGEVKEELQRRTVEQLNTIRLANSQKPPDWLQAKLWKKARSNIAIPYLMKMLDKQNDSVYVTVVDALQELGTEETIPGLVKALKNSAFLDPFAPFIAESALKRVEARILIPGLLKALQNPDPNVCQEAERILGKKISENLDLLKLAYDYLEVVELSETNIRQNFTRIIKDVVLPSWMQNLEASSSYVQEFELNASPEYQHAQALEILSLSEVLKNTDCRVRLKATQRLGELDAKGAISLLLRSLEDPIPGVRWQAAKLLGESLELESELDRVVSGLLKILENPYSGVRWKAAESLGSLGSEKAIPGLLKLLSDQYSDVREAGANSVRELLSKAVLSANCRGKIYGELREAALNDPFSNVRERAAEALGELGVSEAISDLRHLLTDECHRVRRKAAEALGKMGAPDGMPELLEVLKDPKLSLRWRRTAEALG